MADTSTCTGLEGRAVEGRQIGGSFSAAAAHTEIGHVAILSAMRHKSRDLRNAMNQQ
jgi:hypothetical protein